MFSKACEHAIKAMIFIAQISKVGRRAGVKEIAENIDAPQHFIAKILQDLCRKGVLQSMKGPNGGFYLEQADFNTSLAKIVKAVDGDKLYDICVLGLKACSHKNPCPVHHEYVDIKKNIILMLEKNTIEDFNEKMDSGKYYLKTE